MTKNIISLVAIYILNLIDYFVTVYILRRFGIEHELNPIARFLFKKRCAWVVKVFLVPILLTLLGFNFMYTGGKHVWQVYGLLALYFVVVVNNFWALYRVVREEKSIS